MKVSRESSEREDGASEPLLTGHSGHEDLIEQCRIKGARGLPLFPQALLYLLLLVIFVLVLWRWIL